MHIGQQKHCCLYRPKWPGTSLCVAARPPVLRSGASTPVSLSWLACPNFRLFCRGHRPENPRGPQPIVAFEGGPFCYRTVQRSSRSCHSGRFSIIMSKKYVVFFPTKSLQYFHESFTKKYANFQYNRSLASSDISVAVFTCGNFQKIAQISSLCNFTTYLSKGISLLMLADLVYADFCQT